MTVDHEPVPGWSEPSAAERLAVLRSVRTVAMVGVSAKPERPSNFVATYLLSSSTDYDVFFVNPAFDEILGKPCYASLADLPVKPDLVDVFRRLEVVMDRCLKVEHARFHGGLHLAGFDTGVIDSRRRRA